MKLNLHTKPEVPLEAESITPGVINKLKKKEIEKIKIFHGNREVNIADFFKVTENKLDILEVEGDMHRIKYLGANMSDGEMQIEGNVGPHLGSAMSGGFIKVNGNTGDWIAPEMSGGRIHISGNSGHCIASAYRGASKGVTGGEIVIEGIVKKGRQVGKKIGFPTCNIDIKDYVIAMPGVYAAKVYKKNSKKPLKAIVNLGYRPTFSQRKILLEVHIFNFSGNLYNKYLSVEFLKFIRKEKKFKNVNQLRAQIKTDLSIAKKAK